jgi:hypothetical protein
MNPIKECQMECQMWHADLARVFTGETPRPLFETVPAPSLNLPPSNSDPHSTAAMPLAVPRFIITISRVGPCIGISISEVRL